jgi:hypothetical protein
MRGFGSSAGHLSLQSVEKDVGFVYVLGHHSEEVVDGLAVC